MTKSIESPLKSVTASLKALSANAKELRAKKESLHEQLRALRTAPVCLEDFAKYLRNWVAFHGDKYKKSLWLHAMNEPRPGQPTGIMQTSFEELERVSHLPTFYPFPEMSEIYVNRGSMIDALCFFMPEAVFEKLFSAIQETCGKRWGNTEFLPFAQRVAAVETLLSEINLIAPKLSAVESEVAEISAVIADASN